MFIRVLEVGVIVFGLLLVSIVASGMLSPCFKQSSIMSCIADSALLGEWIGCLVFIASDLM